MMPDAGILFTIIDDNRNSRFPNLPFNAGTAPAYGFTPEEAMSTITLNAVTIIGITDKTGSIETGKDDNIVVGKGDILHIRTNIVNDAFIPGRKVDLNNKQARCLVSMKRSMG